MKAPSRYIHVAGPAILLALFAAGGLVGRALALPLPAAVMGLALVLLGLRVGVMVAALEEPQRAGPRLGRSGNAREPRLRAANG